MVRQRPFTTTAGIRSLALLLILVAGCTGHRQHASDPVESPPVVTTSTGGELFTVKLPAIQFQLNALITMLRAPSAARDELCRPASCSASASTSCAAVVALLTDTTKQELCHRFILGNLDRLGVFARSETLTLFRPSQGSLSVPDPSGAPLSVVATTPLGADGLVLVDVDRADALANYDLALVILHELLHKVPLPGTMTYIDDNSPLPEFNAPGGGRTFLNAAAAALTVELIRFTDLPPGSLDMSFNRTGMVTNTLSSNDGGQDYAYSVTVGADQRIFVAGTSVSASNSFYYSFLERLFPDGRLDATFAPGPGTHGAGMVTYRGFGIPSGTARALFYDVATHSDGTLYTAGLLVQENSGHLGFVSHLSNAGVMDPLYGNQFPNHSPAHVTYLATPGPCMDCTPRAITLGSDGTVFATGVTRVDSSSPSRGAVWRVTPQGKLAAAGASPFGATGNGMALTKLTVSPSSFPNVQEWMTTIALDPDDGQIVVAGRGMTSESAKGFLWIERFSSSGIHDETFNTVGYVKDRIAANLDVTVFGLAIQKVPAADGSLSKKILVAGSTKGADQKQRFLLSRYNYDGTLDSSFGTGGRVINPFGDVEAEAANIIVQPNGNLLVGVSVVSASWDLGVARFNRNGELDTVFGKNGVALADFGYGDRIRKIFVQPDGFIVATGFTDNAQGKRRFGVARFVSY